MLETEQLSDASSDDPATKEEVEDGIDHLKISKFVIAASDSVETWILSTLGQR